MYYFSQKSGQYSGIGIILKRKMGKGKDLARVRGRAVALRVCRVGWLSSA